MTTITRNTVVLASEIKSRRTFNRIVSVYKKAGFTTDEHCTKYPNQFSRKYFGMGNFALGFLDEDFHCNAVIVSVAELLGGDV